MVSIIMPTYNRAYIIERAIVSVIHQTYEDWELIIVDDASKDNTREIVKKYISNKILYFENFENKGSNESRNIGVRNAKGEYIAFLDSDNYWPENRLELQISGIEECVYKRCFFYGKVEITDGVNKRVLPSQIMKEDELKKRELYENVIDLNTILLKRGLFLEIGGFSENLPRLQDWELVLRMMYCFNINGVGSEECLSFNEIQENSIGRDKIKFVEAIGFLYKQYICKYLNKEEALNNLFNIIYEKEVPEEMVKNIFCDIGKEYPELLYIAMKFLQKKAYENRISYCMERLLYEWHIKNLYNKEGTIFSKYFYEGSNVKTIAIYGLGKLGKIFFDEVRSLPVEIKYGIDKEKRIFEDLTVKRPDEHLELVDWIIVTMMKESKQIKECLEKRCTGKVFTLEELIY
ncbi:MAG: glycosyltransferase family 2 protein [Dorea sp.]|jgi:glycosyltransferase involved in cell wall biosynthesis|nr:glycosyltransferase family 2 protein [Dorea sp.]